jgi:hypothetical protein
MSNHSYLWTMTGRQSCLFYALLQGLYQSVLHAPFVIFMCKIINSRKSHLKHQLVKYRGYYRTSGSFPYFCTGLVLYMNRDLSKLNVYFIMYIERICWIYWIIANRYFRIFWIYSDVAGT